MEVVETGRRRRGSDAEKLRILEEASLPGARVRAIARRHAVPPSQIYDWRKRFGLARVPCVTDFAAVVVSPEDQTASWPGRMEVRCGKDRTITAGRDVDVIVLTQLAAALKR